MLQSEIMNLSLGLGSLRQIYWIKSWEQQEDWTLSQEGKNISAIWVLPLESNKRKENRIHFGTASPEDRLSYNNIESYWKLNSI